MGRLGQANLEGGWCYDPTAEIATIGQYSLAGDGWKRARHAKCRGGTNT